MSIYAGVTAGFALWLLPAMPAAAQLLSPAFRSLYTSTIAARVESMTILGGDYGVGGGAFTTVDNNDNNVNINVTKFGGEGVVGSPRPLGTLGIGWQPQLQGSMGYLTANNNFRNPLNGGDSSDNKTFAVQFGGGARFWFNDSFSIAPTIMGMYGHSENDYTARSIFGFTHQAAATREGLINWSADTWTIRPSLNVEYQYVWKRTIFTLSTEPTYYYTESFSSSSPYVDISGDSVAWENKIDVDIPLGVELFGHELRTGGFFSRTDLFDGLREGFNTDAIYEGRGRIVLDFLDELWKVQWIGTSAFRVTGAAVSPVGPSVPMSPSGFTERNSSSAFVSRTAARRFVCSKSKNGGCGRHPAHHQNLGMLTLISRRPMTTRDQGTKFCLAGGVGR